MTDLPRGGAPGASTGPATPFDWVEDARRAALAASDFAVEITVRCRVEQHDVEFCVVAQTALAGARRALDLADELAGGRIDWNAAAATVRRQEPGLGMDQEVRASGTGSRGYLRPPGDHLAIPSPALVVERASREPAWTAAGRKGVASPPKPVPSAPSTVVVRA